MPDVPLVLKSDNFPFRLYLWKKTAYIDYRMSNVCRNRHFSLLIGTKLLSKFLVQYLEHVILTMSYVILLY